MGELPHALVVELERALAACDARRLARAAERLSTAYRAGEAARRRVVRDATDALAYAAWLLPATHAQVCAALAMVVGVSGGWRPTSLLDLGAGPGTALWAARAAFPSLERAVAVEREAAFVDLGRRLAAASSAPVVRDAEWKTGHLPGDVPEGPFDVVVLAHVLGELAPAAREQALAAAWRSCAGMLLVVEPGTSDAFAVVAESRQALLRRGARVVAPCPHDRPCPMADDWCHFGARVQRPAFQRRAKGARLGWEDAKLSFAAMARSGDLARPWARVVHSPRRRRHLVELELCTASGHLIREAVPKSRRTAHRFARGLTWGSAVPRAEELLSAPAGEGEP